MEKWLNIFYICCFSYARKSSVYDFLVRNLLGISIEFPLDIPLAGKLQNTGVILRSPASLKDMEASQQ